MRTISMSYPSGRFKMTMWEGTEDEQKFIIRAEATNNPYVIAFGRKYYLTGDEIKALRILKGVQK